MSNLASHSLCQYSCIAGAWHDDQKFLAAPATYQILFTDHGLEYAGCFDQNLVSHGMPPAVIYLLEIIDIDQQYGEFALVPLRSGKFLLEESLRRPPIWYSSQDIDRGHFHQVI